MKTRKNLNNFLLMLVFLLSTLCTAAKGVTWYVEKGNPDAIQFIQVAIDWAHDGDTVRVAPGTYSEPIDLWGKKIHVYSIAGPGQTTITYDWIGPVVRCDKGETSDTILEGFTIISTGLSIHGMLNQGTSPTVINCKFSDNAGAFGSGMYNNNASPTLTNCTFTNNSAEYDGGGMYNYYANPTLTNCTFTGNSAKVGGGMSNWESSPTLTNCMFTNNSAFKGGGMYNWNSSSPTVTSCTFSDNSAEYQGGGMYNRNSSSPTLTNCTFTSNSAEDRGGGMSNYGSSPTLTNCTFTSNSAESYDGGGMYSWNNSSLTLTNCTFSGNSAGQMGGGVDTHYNSSLAADNCSFSGNSAAHSGGGLTNHGSSTTTMTNCTFTDNSATYFGGGLSNSGSGNLTISNCSFSGNSASNGGGMANGPMGSQVLTNCTFSGNSATSSGGGMNSNAANPTVTGCTFTGNSASSGGGMRIDKGIPTVTHCTFSDNVVNNSGGGMLIGGGSPTVTNCAFIGNVADRGGGMSIFVAGSAPMVINCTFTNNSATDTGGVRVLVGCSATITNCILWSKSGGEVFGSASVTYSDVQGGWTGIGNIDADPFFADSEGRLSAGSPCIDAGDNSAVTVTTDLDGNPRIFHVIVDMGAYECMAEPVNTPPGQDVEVSDPDTGTTMLFETVVSGGDTTVTITTQGPPPPTGFKLVPLETYYDIETTAEFSGMIQIAIKYNDAGLTEGQERALKLRCYEEATDEWVNITTGHDMDNDIIYGETNHLSFFAITTGILVEIDIKPGSYPNAINLGSQGVIPVAILSSSDFDATTVKPGTVKLSGAGVAVRGKGDKYMAHEEDINGDGLTDLLVQVETENLEPDETFQYGFVDLTGETYDDVPIKGEDEIIIVPPEK